MNALTRYLAGFTRALSGAPCPTLCWPAYRRGFREARDLMIRIRPTS